MKNKTKLRKIKQSILSGVQKTIPADPIAISQVQIVPESPAVPKLSIEENTVVWSDLKRIAFSSLIILILVGIFTLSQNQSIFVEFRTWLIQVLHVS
jgi:hypothetical protein